MAPPVQIYQGQNSIITDDSDEYPPIEVIESKRSRQYTNRSNKNGDGGSDSSSDSEYYRELAKIKEK